MDLVAARARDVPVGNVLAEIKDVQKQFVEKTMLNNLYEWLPDDETRRFFRKASVYRMPVNHDFLVAAGGSDERIRYLLHKSLLNRIAEHLYEMHSNTRAFGFEKLKEIDGSIGLKETQISAANMYHNAGIESGNADDYLEARRFYFEAGEFDKAGEIVIFLSEPLSRWGYIDLIRELLEKTIDSTSGNLKSGSLHNLGTIHLKQGRFDDAVKLYQESMNIYEELGDRSGIAKILHNLGTIHYLQRRYDRAVKFYQGSMKISEELGDRTEIARGLYQLGMIHQDQSRYEDAVTLYQKSMKIAEELGDRSGIAYSLGQIGIIDYLQGRYDDAVKMCQKSMKIEEELGDRSGIAKALHLFGMIHQDWGRYDDAVKMYQESLRISEELGDRGGIAKVLHQLGMIHQDQSRYDDAVTLYQKSMKIKEELGDRSGIAQTLHQLGNIHYLQGRYDDAVKLYKESMIINEELGDRSGIANSLGQMGRIFLAQKNYKEALRNYLMAFITFDELKSPNKDIVNNLIMKLKEEIGDELFNKYYQEITSDEQREKDSN